MTQFDDYTPDKCIHWKDKEHTPQPERNDPACIVCLLASPNSMEYVIRKRINDAEKEVAETLVGKTIPYYAKILHVEPIDQQTAYMYTEFISASSNKHEPAPCLWDKPLNQFQDPNHAKLQAWTILSQVAEAAVQFRKASDGKGYLDLAPQNILVVDEKEWKIRIVDFIPNETSTSSGKIDLKYLGCLLYFLLGNRSNDITAPLSWLPGTSHAQLEDFKEKYGVQALILLENALNNKGSIELQFRPFVS